MIAGFATVRMSLRDLRAAVWTNLRPDGEDGKAVKHTFMDSRR
jgi:hypothetical protein